MKRHKNLFWFIGAVLLCVSACTEDIPPVVNPPVVDRYEGEYNTITLASGMKGFLKDSFELVLKTEADEIITRKGAHLRRDSKSHLCLNNGLKPGTYRLLCLRYPSEEDKAEMEEYGLGCRVTLSSEVDTAQVLDIYSELMGLYGKGTKEEPFLISSSDHLKRLRTITNDLLTNNLLLPETHFLQTNDINLDYDSWKCDKEHGWLPIGDYGNPFRGIYDGNNHKIEQLWINRPASGGVGLFGYADEAMIMRLNMQDADIEGSFAVGTILGAAVRRGDRRGKTWISQCTTQHGLVRSSAGSMAVGGIVGLVDQASYATLDSCYNLSTPVSGSYGVGGILGVGATWSTVSLQGCHNYTNVTSEYSACGGIIGTCDTLLIMNCRNEGTIKGAIAYTNADAQQHGNMGAGGIVGGAGMSEIYACTNVGDVNGHTGVGGLLGSTCVSREEMIYNTTQFRSCANTGNVTGQNNVGGICGESQLGTYMVYNTGTIEALAENSVVGGIAGNSSIAVIHNTVNAGEIRDNHGECVGGVLGQSTWCTAFACQNLGAVKTSASHVGGIVGRAGNQSLINYCCNAGLIENHGSGFTGGIVGKLGDPHEWSVMNTINCVIGSLEVALGVIGPVLAVTSEGIDALCESVTEGKKVWDAVRYMNNFVVTVKTIERWIHITELAVDGGVLFSELILKLFEGYELIFTHEELEAHTNMALKAAQDTDQEVANAIEDLRKTKMKPVSLYKDLKYEVATEYQAHLKDILDFYQASDENNALINFNLNYERELRAESVESSEHTIEVVHAIIGTVAFAISTAAYATSVIATGGSTLACAAAWIGGAVSVVGGINSLLSTTDDYHPNVVSVTQCVNMGSINAQDNKKTAGILANAHDYSQIKDCLNMGQCLNKHSHSAGIACTSSNMIEVSRCLNVDDTWREPIIDDWVYDADIRNYCLSNAYDVYSGFGFQFDPDFQDYIDVKDLHIPSKYKDWNVIGDNSLWQVKDEKYYFPVPRRSIMQTEREMKEE